MESFAIYLIKVNVALIVLYAFYKLSFSKDTFFRLRRIMLLLICVTSLIYPLIDFSGWTDEYAIGETFTTVYNKLLPEVLVTTALPVATTEVEVTTWQTGIWVWIIYGLGIGMLLLRNLLEVSKNTSLFSLLSALFSERCTCLSVGRCRGALFLFSLDIHKSDTIFG